MSYGASKYKTTNILTATPEQLLIMYYEAAIRHVKRAIDCCEKKDPGGKGEAIGKAHDIVNELANTLDFEKGGQVARELERLYNFMVEQFVRANLEMNPEPLRPVLKMLETLLQAWREAVKKVVQERAEKK